MWALITEYAPQFLPGWVISGSWTHTGSRPLNDTNTADFAPGYGILGLGARYTLPLGDTRATLRVNVDNLLDERYWSNAQFGLLTAGAPRTVSTSLSVRF